MLAAIGLVAIEIIKAGDLVMASDGNGHVGLKRALRAEELQNGDILVTSDGKHVTVEAVEADESVTAETPAMVYNFEVEDWHTYFVGEECVLVHNGCADGTEDIVGDKKNGVGTTGENNDTGNNIDANSIENGKPQKYVPSPKHDKGGWKNF